jgi:hypothetical protein
MFGFIKRKPKEVTSLTKFIKSDLTPLQFKTKQEFLSFIKEVSKKRLSKDKAEIAAKVIFANSKKFK